VIIQYYEGTLQNYDSRRGFGRYCFRFGNESSCSANSSDGAILLLHYILRQDDYKLEILINKYIFKQLKDQKNLTNRKRTTKSTTRRLFYNKQICFYMY